MIMQPVLYQVRGFRADGDCATFPIIRTFSDLSELKEWVASTTKTVSYIVEEPRLYCLKPSEYRRAYPFPVRDKFGGRMIAAFTFLDPEILDDPSLDPFGRYLSPHRLDI